MKQYKIIITFLISLFVFSTYISAQYENSNFGIAFNYSYTTSSKLFLFPNAQDPILRNQNIEMDGVNSYGVDIRYRISEPLIVGLSAEYLKNTKNHGEFSVGGFIIPIDDGFELIPVELTLYYVVPFSTEKFKFYMGGGAGIYFGRHIRNFSDVSVSDIGSETAYGIQVATGMDYIANEFISLRAEMR
ncbi:MAG: outer membrane beta-barrel protein, partial [Melioribacteraceae bacterium]